MAGDREWPGWEKHRESPAGDERRSRAPRPAARRKSESPKWIRYDRRRCCCGAARYVKCRGAIRPEDELASLGRA